MPCHLFAVGRGWRQRSKRGWWSRRATRPSRERGGLPLRGCWCAQHVFRRGAEGVSEPADEQVESVSGSEVVAGAGNVVYAAGHAHHQAIAAVGTWAARARLEDERAAPQVRDGRPGWHLFLFQAGERVRKARQVGGKPERPSVQTPRVSSVSMDGELGF